MNFIRSFGILYALSVNVFGESTLSTVYNSSISTADFHAFYSIFNKEVIVSATKYMFFSDGTVNQFTNVNSIATMPSGLLNIDDIFTTSTGDHVFTIRDTGNNYWWVGKCTTSSSPSSCSILQWGQDTRMSGKIFVRSDPTSDNYVYIYHTILKSSKVCASRRRFSLTGTVSTATESCSTGAGYLEGVSEDHLFFRVGTYIYRHSRLDGMSLDKSLNLGVSTYKYFNMNPKDGSYFVMYDSTAETFVIINSSTSGMTVSYTINAATSMTTDLTITEITRPIINGQYILFYSTNSRTFYGISSIDGTYGLYGDLFGDKTYYSFSYPYSVTYESVNDSTFRMNIKDKTTDSSLGGFIFDIVYTAPTAAPTASPTYECTVSEDCGSMSDTYCSAHTCQQTACTVHSDCAGLVSNVPYCHSGYCTDEITGSCDTTAECSNLVNMFLARRDAVGSVTQTVRDTTSISKSREGARELVSQLKSNTAVTQTVTAQLSSTEYAVFDGAMFDKVGNETAVLEALKAQVCGSDVPNLCNISVEKVTGYRRALSDDGSSRELAITEQYKVSVTFVVDDSAYSSIPDGSFDSSTFLTDVATTLGINASDITILDSDGTVTIEYIVSKESTTKDPLTATNLAALSTIDSELAALLSTVETSVGLTSGSIGSTTVDKCAGRTCNGRGTCDSATGVCTCTDSNYWGLNCETAVDCNTGTKATGSAYCICDYPTYGLRCENSLTCPSATCN